MSEVIRNNKNIGTIWYSKTDPTKLFNISVNPYHGNLYFEDKVSGNLYLVKSATLFEKRAYNGNPPPAGSAYDMVLDLYSAYQVDLIQEGSKDAPAEA